VAAEIRRAAFAATTHRREVLISKMTDAVTAYDRGRFEEAARLGKQVAKEAPSVAAVHQLVGLAAYRSGMWREAIRQLDLYEQLTGEVDQRPALMDCHRALGKPRKVADLWSELRLRSPDADVLAEGRMVAAGMLADRGKLADALTLLVSAGAGRALRNPSDRHLRQWYALADLYERAGDLPRARELFLRVQRADPGAFDVAERLTALGPSRPRRGRTAPARTVPSGSATPRSTPSGSATTDTGPAGAALGAGAAAGEAVAPGEGAAAGAAPPEGSPG
jgi:tetratricopeptide (TPR) repeat protein